MAESTQIRIDVDVKQRLEEVKGQSKYSKLTHSDTIDYLINSKRDADKELREIKSKLDQDKYDRDEALSVESARRREQDITLGSDRKESLKHLADQLGLYDENRVIDFLLYEFSKNDKFDKDSLFYLADLSKGN